MESPFVVINELVCWHLAQALLLPIPPGFLIEHDAVPHYVSLNFNLAGEELPPADAADVVAADPALACGIVAFDAWLLNADRHPGNIAHDAATGRVQIFDHANAFLGKGRAHLEVLKGSLDISNHCLVRELRTPAGFSHWLPRMAAIPRYYIEDVVRSTMELGLSADDAGFCIDVLETRRRALPEMLRRSRDAFPRIEARLWGDFNTDPEVTL